MLNNAFKNTKPCLCNGPGFCDRHNIEKNREQWIECLRNKALRFNLDLKTNTKSCFITTEDLINITLKKVCPQIIDAKFIVGIPRSGMIPASILATHLHLDLYSLNQKDFTLTNIGSGNRFNNTNAGETIYLVDDSSCSGGTLQVTKNILEKIYPNSIIKTVAIIISPLSSVTVDIYGLCLEQHYFEWNLPNMYLGVAFDMDGVLCRDFTEEEDDDGERYISAMESISVTNIQPRRNPIVIITARLEKYRKQTENWLLKNNFKIDNIYMMGLKSKNERTFEKIIKHKSDTYLMRDDLKFMIESDDNQAKEIALITKKPVICNVSKNVY